MQDKTLNVRASLQVTSNFQTQAQTMQATLIVEAEVAKAFAYTCIYVSDFLRRALSCDCASSTLGYAKCTGTTSVALL